MCCRLPQFMIPVFFNTHYWRKSVIYLRTGNDFSLLFWKKEPAYWDGASIILKVFTGSIDLSKWPAVTRFTVHFTVFGRCKSLFLFFPTGRVRMANLQHVKAFLVTRLKKHALPEKHIKNQKTLAKAKLLVSGDVTGPAGFTTGIQLSTKLNTLTLSPSGARNLMVSQYLSWPTDTRAQSTNNAEPPRGTPGDKVIVVL
ncbi:hypothetical protein ALC62_04072 [Cyphomyrmex costatus]|uniref:Uncharacterized protein n=1 Tax=Cyphomyrmex costatus TaxID=456900 RepID=A0A195CY60_9HYME|nr:hypothetical protein ALC62_04072 [Cyphomyrmex costatus]